MHTIFKEQKIKMPILMCFEGIGLVPLEWDTNIHFYSKEVKHFFQNALDKNSRPRNPVFRGMGSGTRQIGMSIYELSRYKARKLILFPTDRNIDEPPWLLHHRRHLIEHEDGPE